VVLLTFTALTLQPLTAAAQLPSAPKRAPAQPVSGEERFSRTLNEIHEVLKEVVPQSAMPHRSRGSTPEAAGKPGEKVLQAVGPKMRMESERAKPLPGIDIAAKVKSLRGKYKELKSLEAEVTKGFKETEKHIRDKNLPAEILARHEQAVAEYDRRKTEFTTLMDAVEAADDGKGNLAGALSSLGEFMAKYPNQKTHTPTDPNNLPWGSPKPVTRAPYTSPSQFKTSRLFGEPVKVAQAGSLSGISLPTTVLPTTPTPADTAPTEDVQITQAIRDLATSLGNAPVPIYKWVRNNIQFIPSYGSMQGSDMTLQTKRGNAFDTASLLIALFRAANIPARYVYGTIEVPADKAMNWVGGVTVPQAAMNLMGQGGIPTLGVSSGGQIRSIRLEHVWVEAYVDYIPSRGAVNKIPSTWVPLDASFKQYQYTQGVDVAATVQLDPQAFLSQIQQGAVVNEAEGSVSNINQAAVQQAMTNFRTQAANALSTRYPNATLADLAGNQTIVQENGAIILGTLPYTRIATGAKLQALPDNLRWKFQYNVYASDFDRATDSPAVSYVQSTSLLAGKSLVLSFKPATGADATTLNSFLPQAHADGSPFAGGELPQSLPGYLIHVIPTLQINGQTVGTGPAVTMGTELIQNSSLYDPMRGWVPASDNRPTAGEVYSTFVKTGPIAEGTVARAADDAEAVKQAILSEDAARVLKPVRALLHAMLVSYFYQSDNVTSMIGKITKVASAQLPGFGATSVGLQTQYYFGVPRNLKGAGYFIDIDLISYSAAGRGATDNASQFLQVVGRLLSGLEHAIPEKLLSTDTITREGVSAVKLIAEASRLGQKIFNIDASNVDLALAQLTVSADVKNEIANAVAAGKRAVAHQQNVTISGWTGAGYIIIDPQTGSGAYKISGGTNGGGVSGDQEFWGEALLNTIFDMLEKFGKDMAKFLGAAMGYLMKLLDVIKIFTECSGIDLFMGLVIYVWFTLLSMLLVETLLIAFGPWGAVIGVILAVLMMSYMTEAILHRCRMS